MRKIIGENMKKYILFLFLTTVGYVGAMENCDSDEKTAMRQRVEKVLGLGSPYIESDDLSQANYDFCKASCFQKSSNYGNDMILKELEVLMDQEGCEGISLGGHMDCYNNLFSTMNSDILNRLRDANDAMKRKTKTISSRKKVEVSSKNKTKIELKGTQTGIVDKKK
jgi:hypothetical protein